MQCCPKQETIERVVVTRPFQMLNVSTEGIGKIVMQFQGRQKEVFMAHMLAKDV